ATIAADNVTLMTDGTSTLLSTLNVDGHINKLTAMTSMQVLSLNNDTDLTLSDITMSQGSLTIDVKGQLTQSADITLTNNNAQLISDGLLTQNANVAANASTLTVKAGAITQSIDSVITTDSAVHYQATQGDIGLAQMTSQTSVTLEAAGKVFSVLDSETATNVTAKELTFSSLGHFVDHQNLGFINAVAALEKNLLKVKAEIFIDGDIDGSVKQVSDTSDLNYLVNEQVDSKDTYLQFLSQSSEADYGQLVDDTLSMTQMEFALNRFITTETELNSAKVSVVESNSLLERLLEQQQSIENDETDSYGVEHYDYLSLNTGSVFQGNQSTIDGSSASLKTQFERQLEESVLRTSSISQVRSLGSLSSNIVNSFGNRQIDVFGGSLNNYLYDYFLDTEEDALLENIL
ncbi:MAG: hypothetical protein HRU23_19415, partial [Gammaproteobacteria bacterium]|nr:hypothetical protein [Gammaproteobacteria bacterium]